MRGEFDFITDGIKKVKIADSLIENLKQIAENDKEVISAICSKAEVQTESSVESKLESSSFRFGRKKIQGTAT